MRSAVRVERLGPLLLGTFRGGRGFVSYAPFAATGNGMLGDLVDAAVAHFSADPEVTEFEWKTRGHDELPGLEQLLTERGLVPEEPESVMVGEAAALAVDVPLPAGVSLQQVTDRAGLELMCTMQATVFGDPPESVGPRVEDHLREFAEDTTGMEAWVAVADGKVISAGRVNPVPGTNFAGIWGGSTLPEWRGKGIYRALTAARARAALRAGKSLINSDSTEYSRPILERYGFAKVTTTTPYIWRR
ncbi:GNAT family N-acetyltransferase [Flexivirga sp. ID2601S]|uniref:GNAT family N-acetyltransferase n=2 Tax=Flexivirga aerilata TaxID=1656889 RepID=A0A849AFK2_9MICO|nr:GNAT family N-acetyltransferase [Flexivirga aerilata]NNG38021.1 GNAT family N-acetyltransferase [Flexivirga aerilata]